MAQRGGAMIINGNNIQMIRGDSEAIGLEFVNKDGSPYSFEEGDIVYFTVKRTVNTERVAIQKKKKNLEGNKVDIEIKPSDTSELEFGNYVYDIQYNKEDGTVKTIIPPSEFIINGEVTYE